MISGHFQKVHLINSRNLLLLAGMLLIIGQLVAVAMVADGQVKKAQGRNSDVASQKLVVAQCLESSVGSNRQACSRQARVTTQLPDLLITGANNAAPVFSSSSAISTFNDGVQHYGNVEGVALKQVADSQAALSTGQSASAQSLMPLVFNAQ